jgi:hypothetical protein
LVAAISHKKLRQLELEGLRPPEAPEPRVARSASTVGDAFGTISTQRMSLRVEEKIDPDRLSAPPQMLLESRQEQSDSPIIESVPAAWLERARKDLNYSAVTNATVIPAAPAGEKIVVE